MSTIFTTTGVYNNGDKVINGVSAENLADHVKYNLTMRPGRAFFLNGVCLHKGYLDQERIEQYEAEFLKMKFMTIDTAPYL